MTQIKNKNEFARAVIINTNTKNKDDREIKVLFNPEKYTLEKSNQFAEIGIPGLESPLLQYIRGNIKTLTMELFFDTYEKRIGFDHEAGDDVRTTYVDKITKLMEIDAELHAPPVCEFSWGSLSFRGILERATRNFTMFGIDGRPLRCTMNVTFKEYQTVEFLTKSAPKNSPDRTKVRIFKQGDRLSHLAFQEYDDPALWRPIAEANNIDNPRLIEPGTELTIPPLD